MNYIFKNLFNISLEEVSEEDNIELMLKDLFLVFSGLAAISCIVFLVIMLVI